MGDEIIAAVGARIAANMVVPEMEESAIHAVAQGWCEPEVSHREMDPELAKAISKPVARALSAWYETAAQHCRNEVYYRGLVQQIGALLGPEAYTDDSGGVHEEVLCAKVPELVRKLLADIVKN